MEKILFVQNNINTNSGALDFACYLATLTKSKITGIFIGGTAEDDIFIERRLEKRASSPWPIAKPVEQLIENMQVANHNITAFKQACERRSTRHSVHLNFGDPAATIIKETRYADVLVIDAELTLGKHPEEIPSSFVSNILKETECPVIIAPQSFEGTEQIIFAHDGSKSSMFAIKQFCYLFPQLDDKKVTVLQIDDGRTDPDGDHDHFKEWVSAHYNSIGFITAKGDAETELLSFLLKKENSIVVMGAYGRSMVASIFKHSHAERLIKILNQPIFIAHP